MNNKETDLYEPIKKYFESKNFTVHGEVKGCDLIARSGNELIAVELKLSVSLKLIFQAMERKKTVPLVYVAVPRPKSAKSKHYKSSVQLLKTLGVGLIVVALDSPAKMVEIVLIPEICKPTNSRKASAIKKEIEGRSADYNKGGTSRQKIITAYRERSIKIAVLMNKLGRISVKKLIEEHDEDKSVSGLLSRNYYDWFNRVDKGVYDLSEKGIDALLDERYAEIVEFYTRIPSKQ